MYSKIRAICKQKGITIYELENRLGFSNGTIYHWKDSTPNAHKLAAVCKELGVPLSEFIGADKEKPAGDTDGQEGWGPVIRFLASLPPERLRGILLAVGAPKEVLDALDRAKPQE